jgi:hypothetical protein
LKLFDLSPNNFVLSIIGNHDLFLFM